MQLRCKICGNKECDIRRKNEIDWIFLCSKCNPKEWAEIKHLFKAKEE